jgi:hypothetical protein
MAMSLDALVMRVIVRRTGIGVAPFTWEVHGNGITPIHVSPDRYKSMEAAYKAGQNRLTEFIPSRKSKLRRSDRDEPVPMCALRRTNWRDGMNR